MAFLTINSWPIPIKLGNGERIRETIGGLSRGAGNSLRASDRASKPGTRFTTTILDRETCETLEKLFSRHEAGHHFPFNADLYSAVGGVGPEAGYTVSVEATGTTKFGNKLIASVTTNTVILQYALELTGEYTIMWWQQSGISGTWNHFVKRSSGDSWIDGVQSNPGTASVVVSSGTLQLKGCTNAGGTGTTQCFDDLVVLPFYLADDAIPYFAARTSPFSDLPRLLVAGDFDRSSEFAVVGEFEKTTLAKAVLDGAMANNAGEVTFSLRKV